MTRRTLLLALGGAELVLLASLWMVGAPRSSFTDDAVAAAKTAAPTAYDVALVEIDDALAAARRHAAKFPNDWAHLEAVARIELGRAQLTGRLEDYRASRDTIDRAFVLANGVGPFLERARIEVALHQLPAATRDLDVAEGAILLLPGEKGKIVALRADIAFQSGRYAEALAKFHELHAGDPHAGSAFRLALYLWKTGDIPGARRWLSEAEAAAVSARERAWFALQQGLTHLDLGEHELAAQQYARAAELFPGWWLIEEHQAEVAALRGDRVGAESMYRGLIERTGSPEFMDALAELVADRAPDEAAAWVKRAGEYHARWMSILPEASYGHALEHALEYGDAGEALTMAQRNFELRPGGPASAFLVRALAGAGRCADARSQLDALRATPFRGVEMDDAADALATCRGDGGSAPPQ